MEAEPIAVMREASARGLANILIGGHAVILLGFIRSTADLDLMVPSAQRSRWLDLLREMGYRFYNGTGVFAQFEPPHESGTPVDLMFVDSGTWEKVLAGTSLVDVGGESVRLPRPEIIIALKLHAAKNATRSRPESDWEDIRQIVRIHQLNPDDETFKKLILRYGDADALQKIQQFATAPG
jgi:hypothetical protein